jgi:hypothetical protein
MRIAGLDIHTLFNGFVGIKMGMKRKKGIGSIDQEKPKYSEIAIYCTCMFVVSVDFSFSTGIIEMVTTVIY